MMDDMNLEMLEEQAQAIQQLEVRVTASDVGTGSAYRNIICIIIM
jgi:hypothetical protein